MLEFATFGYKLTKSVDIWIQINTKCQHLDTNQHKRVTKNKCHINNYNY